MQQFSYAEPLVILLEIRLKLCLHSETQPLLGSPWPLQYVRVKLWVLRASLLSIFRYKRKLTGLFGKIFTFHARFFPDTFCALNSWEDFEHMLDGVKIYTIGPSCAKVPPGHLGIFCPFFTACVASPGSKRPGLRDCQTWFLNYAAMKSSWSFCPCHKTGHQRGNPLKK
jgi:hypothetical protein